MLLNARQRELLQTALGWEGRHFLPSCEVVELLGTMASLPDALPRAWRSCSEVAFAEVRAGMVCVADKAVCLTLSMGMQLASKCTRRRQGFVEVAVLLAALSSDESELRRVVAEDRDRERL